MQARNIISFQVAHDDHMTLVDAHVSVKQCVKANTIFKKFLVKVLHTQPSELATLSDYQTPYGKLEETTVLHILHWPPDPTPRSTQPTLSSGPARFRFECYTLKVVTDMLPTAKDEPASMTTSQST